jgi:phage gpG-like protein
MSETFTSYSVDNDGKFRAALKRAAEVSTDLRIPFGLILSDFYKSQAAIFKLQGPGQYPPFKGDKVGDTGKTRYQLEKIKAVGHDYPLLVRSGALANSLLGPNNKGSVALIGKSSLIIGTLIKYGIYHQSDEPRSKIPLRKFLFIGPEASRFATSEQAGRLQRWLGILEHHIQTQIKKAGLNNG